MKREMYSIFERFQISSHRGLRECLIVGSQVYSIITALFCVKPCRGESSDSPGLSILIKM